MRKTKIIATGGTGYIGSHTVVELLSLGYEVVIADNLSNSHVSVIDRIEKISGTRPQFVNLDLCDDLKSASFFEEHADAAGIIHFAAFKAVGESVTFPLKYYHNNLLSMVQVLHQAQRQSIPFHIFSSSATVYGQPDRLPVTEKSPIKPAESPYGKTKQICEDILKDAIAAHAIRAGISLRYFNPVGAHSSALIGELPQGIPNNLMPYITQTAAGEREMLNVFGGDYATKDGTPIRDYIHVVDLAKAHVLAMERLINNQNHQNYEIFNLGTGKGSSVLEVIQAFEAATGLKIPYKIVDRRPGDVEVVYADPTLARLDLGWKAELGLEEMAASSWAWEKYYRQNIEVLNSQKSK